MACLDHKYEPGPYDVCRRCGEERPLVMSGRWVTQKELRAMFPPVSDQAASEDVVMIDPLAGIWDADK